MTDDYIIDADEVEALKARGRPLRRRRHGRGRGRLHITHVFGPYFGAYPANTALAAAHELRARPDADVVSFPLAAPKLDAET